MIVQIKASAVVWRNLVPHAVGDPAWRFASLNFVHDNGKFGCVDRHDRAAGFGVGIFLRTLVSLYEPFLVYPNNSFSELSSIDPLVKSWSPAAINARGDILGSCTIDQRMFAYIASTRKISLLEFGAQATAISDDGQQIVGGLNESACIWRYDSQAGHFIPRLFDCPVQAPLNCAFGAINANVDAVGSAIGVDSMAFLLPRDGKQLVNITTLFPSDAPLAKAWAAMNIDNSGRIFGAARARDNSLHGFVLIP